METIMTKKPVRKQRGAKVLTRKQMYQQWDESNEPYVKRMRTFTALMLNIACDELGYSMAFLSRRSGVSVQTLRNLRDNKTRYPSVTTMMRIADVVNVTIITSGNIVTGVQR